MTRGRHGLRNGGREALRFAGAGRSMTCAGEWLALVQDAVFPSNEMTFLRGKRRFAICCSIVFAGKMWMPQAASAPGRAWWQSVLAVERRAKAVARPRGASGDSDTVG